MSNTDLNNCAKCPVHNLGNLKKLGINMNSFDFVVALAGNPNTGKSTVFNYLTGLKQHTGNWPGKTVIRAEGGFEYNQKKFKLVDLPGTYSLLSTSTDEEVARDFILFGQPDVTIVVADATRLERNLNLVLQILYYKTYGRTKHFSSTTTTRTNYFSTKTEIIISNNYYCFVSFSGWSRGLLFGNETSNN